MARTLRQQVRLEEAQARWKRDDGPQGLGTSGAETGNNGGNTTDDDAVPDGKCKVESGVTGTGGSRNSNAGDDDLRRS